jgi:hypothetical protein
MSDALRVRAEVIKLARLLGREADDLAYLHQVHPAAIRRLREQATDMLFEAQSRRLRRLARASRLLPPTVLATIAERAFGPLLAGRVTGYLAPARAGEVAARLSVAFRANLAVEMDPRRTSDVIARLPAQSIAEVARELGQREEYVTMGRFAGQLTDEALRAVFAVVDDAALLRVAFVIEDEERLDHVFGLLPAPRRAGFVRAAATVDLWPEALDLLSRLSERRCGELADAAAAQEAVLHSIVRAAQDDDLWNALLRAARAMGDENRRRLAERLVGPVSELNETQREHIAELARDAGVFDGLGALRAVLESR